MTGRTKNEQHFYTTEWFLTMTENGLNPTFLTIKAIEPNPPFHSSLQQYHTGKAPDQIREKVT